MRGYTPAPEAGREEGDGGREGGREGGEDGGTKGGRDEREGRKEEGSRMELVF